MENLLQDKIHELISLRNEGWEDSEDGLMTYTHTNYYSYGNNENDITKVLYSVEQLKSKKSVDNLKRMKLEFSNDGENWQAHYSFHIKNNNCENYKTLLGGNYRLALSWVKNAVNKGRVLRYKKIQNVEFLNL
ncbi:hypothetical protein N9L33_05505 [Nitrospinae bacterium]|nr:hypothetical protein [Nitrospinota bacterium]